MPATSARTPFVFPCDTLRAMSSVAGQAIGRPLKVASPAAGSFRRSRLFVKDFYLIMSLVIAVVVVYGFSHTVDQRLIHPSPTPPWILYLHATVFSGWVLFFILQSTLVRTRNVRIHRTLGWFGVALGCAIPLIGVSTAVTMDRFRSSVLHHANAGRFAIISFTDMLCFAIAFALAVYWRKKPDYHRRLMFIASCALTAAAFGRIPIVVKPHTFYAGVDALILCGLLRDWIADGKISIVYRYALPAIFAIQAFALYTLFAFPPYWQAAAHLIAP
jgi:hypothetical protein